MQSHTSALRTAASSRNCHSTSPPSHTASVPMLRVDRRGALAFGSSEDDLAACASHLQHGQVFISILDPLCVARWHPSFISIIPGEAGRRCW
ncbi:hypothetical protein E4U61_000046 [Claviceps capensis]|nr:hypothetical protein E4U61_000046 [Claviceps capensis]